MEWYAWLMIGIVTVIFAVIYVLDEIEFSRRMNELAEKGTVIWIIRL